MSYLDFMDQRTGFIASAAYQGKGKELQEQYSAATPFPSIMIDDFLPAGLAETLLENFGDKYSSKLNESYDRPQERLKSSYHPDSLNDTARTIFYAFNSLPFIKIMENITGIDGLIPDPYYFGAGYHEIKNGGHLSIHADFNHHKLLNLERRINVLIYFNKDWDADFGGQIELWNDKVTEQVKAWTPAFNRCVIFNTTSTSMHGNPQVVNHPLGISRKSVALYYYTSTWDDLKRSHTTQFRTRPGTSDKVDWMVRLQEMKNDLLPPFVIRSIKKMKRAAK